MLGNRESVLGQSKCTLTSLKWLPYMSDDGVSRVSKVSEFVL